LSEIEIGILGVMLDHWGEMNFKST
jgi:hypothetical protein